MKKTLALILAILMIVTSVPFAFAAESSFAITHQPTIDEFYVETNDSKAKYQWYEIKSSYEIDSTRASSCDPTSYSDFSYYDNISGWIPSYEYISDGYSMNFFEIIFQDYENLTFEFSSDEIEYAYLFDYNTDESVDVDLEGNTGTCTVEPGEYTLIARAPELETVKVRSDGYRTAMAGETSTHPDLTKIKNGNEYFCEVVFSNGASKHTNKVLAHQHTGTELTCMGYKCVLCDGYFGEATGEHSDMITCMGRKCTHCGITLGEETADHSFTSYVVTIVPTATKSGVEVALCDYGCGAFHKRNIPAGSFKAEIDAVYDEYGDRRGFNTIKIGNTSYYNVLPIGATLDEMSVGDFYKTVLTQEFNNENLLDRWSLVADNIFRYGGKEFGYNWEFGNYDTWYATDKTNVSGNNKANGDIVLRDQLASTTPYASGNFEDYCVRATGLQSYSSLNKVQEAMLEQIVDVCGERDVATQFKDVVLEFCTGDKKGLKLLQDTEEQPVIAHIVTNQYDAFATERYFSSFGIAFYDFELTPIVKGNLEYISAADDYESVEEAFKNNAPGVSYVKSSDSADSIVYIQNPTAASTSVNASTSKSVSYSVSNSFSESESYSFSESVGMEFEGGISSAVKMKVGIDFSTEQALSTAYSESTSLSDTISTSSSVSVELPPYTEIGVKQSVNKVEQSVEYECPVYITYKVAIFGLNAQYYQDTGTGSWSTANYDQGSICVGFGSDATDGGIKAPENLYNRLKESSVGFELSYGNVWGMYEDQFDGHDPVNLTYIDWNACKDKSEILKDAQEMVNWVPMSSIGGKMVAKTDAISTEITSIYPMYDLKRIRFDGTGAYTLGIGGKLDLNTVDTIGLNQFDREYYGYLPRMGTWYICDEDGNDITFEEGKGISIEPTPSTQTIIAHELGEYYVRFDIDEQYYTKASDRSTYITNDDLEFNAILKLSVTDTGNDHICRPGSWVTYIPSNCVIEGERYKYCLTCSKRMAVEVIPKADHIPVDTVVPATCVSDGCKTTTCVTCQTIISNEVIPKTDHVLVDIITPATCKTAGNKTTTCSSCQAVISSEVIPAKGHGSTYGLTTITPTCTRDGEKALYCSDCNAIVGSQAIPSTGHDNGVWRIDFEATPAYEGQMTKYCSTCNVALESRNFAYHTHSLASWRTNDDGTHSRSCSCGYTEMNDCNYTETVTPATCTVDGTTTYKCKDCNHEYSAISSTAPGHSWGEYISNNDATTEADGTKTATCGACGEKDTVIDEGSKIVDVCEHINTHAEHKDATCTEDGYDKVVCDDCGNTVSLETLPKAEHNITTGILNPTCEEAGAEICYCKDCSYACITEHLDPLGHSELVWETVNAPSTRNAGTMNHICPACDEVFDTKTVPAINLSGNSTANINFETNTITGFDSGSTSIEDYLAATNYGYTFACDSDTIGTGSVITLKTGEDLINEYEAVVFGDVNGDGWYDGQDAIIVDCLANGMLTKDDVSEAVYMAADCNHDGVIDKLDVDLLNQAGTLLANVDQTKSAEVLLETSSAYVEYISLIDQTLEIENDGEAEVPEVDGETDEAPESDAEDSEPVVENSIFAFISEFIAIFEKLFNFILGFVNV